MVMDAAALRLADLESRRICRFCLRTCSTDGLTEIGKDSKLVSRIGFALTLEVATQDGLPQRICDGCEWLMEKFYLFKDQCVRAEMLLKTFAESGMPLMQYFEPVDFAEFRWQRKWENGVDVGVQVEEAMGMMAVVKKEKLEPEEEFEIIAPEMIKQEEDEEYWSLAEEPVAVESADQSDRITMDEIARQLYGIDENAFPFDNQGVDESMPDGVNNMTELVTEMDIGSPHLVEPIIALYEDISNDTVEFTPLSATATSSVQPGNSEEPIKPTTSYPNYVEAMLLLMKDEEQHEPKSPQSPSDLIYEDLQTAPLRESDGLSSRFVNMEPGEIVSDDEYDTVVVISSDTEDNQPVPAPVAVPVPVPVESTPNGEEYQCQKCDKFFPQSQLLESHIKAYHLVSPGKSGAKKFVPGKSAAKTSPVHKMAIMIDNPTKKCPKCGAMVHTPSYWKHLKSHRSGEELLVNYEKKAESEKL